MIDILPVFVVLAVITAVLVIFIWPKLGLYSLLLFAPFSYYYAYLGPPVLFTTGTFLQRSTKDILTVIVYLSFALYIVFAKKEIKLSAIPLTYLVLAFSGMVIIRMLCALPYSGYDALIGMRNMAEYLPLAFLVPLSFTTKKGIKTAINMFFSCSTIVILLALYEIYFRSRSFLGVINFRIVSTLYNPNNLALYLCILLLALAGLYLKKVYFINRSFSFFLIGCSFAITVLTFSRGPILGLIMAVLFLLFLGKGNKTVLYLCIIPVVSGMLFFAFFYNDTGGLLTRYSQIVGVGQVDRSTTARLGNVSSAWEILSQEPYLLFTGLGFDKVTGIAPINADSGQIGKDWRATSGVPTDSFYLSLFAGGGIFSLLIFVSIFFLLIWESIKFSLRTSDQYFKGLSQGMSAIFVAYAVVSVTLLALTTFPGAFYFWFFVGILFSMKRIEKGNSIC